nr:MAG TPA: hypothetical protein [Caudoviricetes sp.]
MDTIIISPCLFFRFSNFKFAIKKSRSKKRLLKTIFNF